MNDIQTNVSIDFEPKKSVTPKVPPTQSSTKPSTTDTTKPAPSRSSSPRPSSARGTRKPTSSQTAKKYSGAPAPVATSAHTFTIKKGEKPVKVGSLAGLEQVGQCIFIEYENDIILVDAGMEFAADELTMGADYIIPDISYIKKNIKKLRGIVLTHGHLDHIGALRDILPELNRPTVYTTPLTLGIIKKTFEDPRNIAKLKFKIVDPTVDIVKLGCFSIEFAEVNHNIPETYALSIHTPKGIVFTSADFKFDYTPALGKPAELSKIARIGTEGVKLYIGDSLNAQKKGYVPSEKEIGKTLEDIIQKATGRLVIATFATNVGRIIQIVKNSIKHNKICFLSGRSMLNNVEICQELGYINVPRDKVRKLDKSADEMPDGKVVILCTGAQGEEFSALARMSRNEHHQVTLRKGDTILLSASVIPGNELGMKAMKNNLVTKDIKLITNDDMDVHASGHGGAEDHKLMLHLLKPDYFLPFYLDATARYAHKDLALDMGFPEEKILMPNENGAIIELYDNGVRLSDKKIKMQTVMIDGKGVGHLSGEYVIRARKIMSNDGMVAFILKIDTLTKELIGNIQIESRGFVYSSEVRKIHTEIVNYVRKKYNAGYKKGSTRDVLKRLKDDLGNYINNLIGRSPMIVPTFVYINRDAVKNEGVDEDEAIVGMTLEEQGE